MKTQKLRTNITITTDEYIIIYSCIDDSFDHEFGTEKQYSYEIEHVALYVQFLDDYFDEDKMFSDSKDKESAKIKQKISDKIDKIVEMDIASNGYFYDNDDEVSYE